MKIQKLNESYTLTPETPTEKALISSLCATLDGERMIPTNEAAKKLGVHPATLKRWAYEGTIRAYTAGKSYGFKHQDIEALLSRRQLEAQWAVESR